MVGRSHRRGAEQVAVELAAELDALGHGNVLRAIGPGHEGEQVPELPTLTDSNRHRPLTLFRAGLALRKELRRADVDVVMAHGAAAAVAAVVGAPRTGPKVVWQTILGMAERSFRGADALMWKAVIRRVDALVALTPAMGEEVRGLGFDGPIWSLPNARNAARFRDLDRATAELTLRSEISVPDAAPLLGFVGYLVDQKRPQRAVDVLAAVSVDHPDAHLVLVGSGPLEGAVAAHVAASGLGDRVHLLGHRDDVPEVLAGLDVFLLTSSDEGVPGVVIEAAMAGCPVVTHDLGGVAEVVLDGVTGRVVAGDEVPAFAAAVLDVLADPARRRSMGEAAVAHADQFSMASVARRYEQHLRELIETGG